MNYQTPANELYHGAGFRIGASFFDPAERAVWVRGARVALEPRQADLLDLLIRNAGQTMPRDRLLDAIWGASGSDEALTQAVSRLRRALDDAGVIKTVPRIGYRMEAEPELVERTGVEPVATAAPPQHARAGYRVDWRSAALSAGIGALLTAVVFLALFQKEVVTETEEIINGQTIASSSTATCGLLTDCDDPSAD